MKYEAQEIMKACTREAKRFSRQLQNTQIEIDDLAGHLLVQVLTDPLLTTESTTKEIQRAIYRHRARFMRTELRKWRNSHIFSLLRKQ